jgi:hypothetical protein
MVMASLSLSIPTFRKKDKKATEETRVRHDLKTGAVATWKRLLPENCPEYKEVVTAFNKMRNDFYSLTSPWCDNGNRVLASSNYMKFAEVMRNNRDAIEQALGKFYPVVPSLKQQARVELNGLYNESDYPSEAKLQRQFSVKVLLLPMPEIDSDWRLGLSQEITDSIVTQTQEDLKDGLREAQNYAVTRLATAIKHLAERLEADGRLHESAFGNLREICELLPGFNLLSDPNLDAIAQRLQTEVLAVYGPKACRENKAVRMTAANAVNDILSSMQGLYGDVTATEEEE